MAEEPSRWFGETGRQYVVGMLAVGQHRLFNSPWLS